MDYQSIYFVGAGGIGMANLERYFLSKGIRVAGYDRTPSALTRALEREGAQISYQDDATLIPDYCRDPKTTLVVYTPAVPATQQALSHFRASGFRVIKRAELLGIITRGTKSLCFSGTHGKTTTSSMAGHILNLSPIGCNAFLGGILKNYDSNLILSSHSPYSVIEADEFDRSFHHLSPYIAVVTATDPDHLDIYGTEEAYLESFAHFTSLVAPGGALIIHTGLKLKPRPAQGVRVYSYSRDEGDFHAANIRKADGEITFDFVTPNGTVTDIRLGVPVDINIENAVAAMAACTLTGCDGQWLRQGIATFQGARRRFDFWIKEPGDNGKVVLDDYAHHPDEVRASIRSIRDLYPTRRITAIFQPHLYTRTRDFAPQFAQALSGADKVMLLPIYPAREQPIPGITSEIILNQLTCPERELVSKDQLLQRLRQHNPHDILLTVGAGDIADLLPDICKTVRSL